MDIQPFLLTLEMALLTTMVLFIIGIPIAHWLHSGKSRLKLVVEAILTLPLILPPSVLGFYLLLLFSPSNFFGRLLASVFNIQLVFTFEGLVVASVIYSMPFMVQPILSGLRTLPASLAEASYSLGKGRVATIWKVLLPNIKASLITAGILSFAHTVGEFGVVLMIGGNIPGETKVVSVAIYDEVEAMNYSMANAYSLVLLIISFILLLFVYVVNHVLQKKHLTT
jgi:molybdate transport system permease protein